jgi:hypothetical protein
MLHSVCQVEKLRGFSSFLSGSRGHEVSSGFSKENMRCLSGRREYFAYNGLKKLYISQSKLFEVLFIKENNSKKK